MTTPIDNFIASLDRKIELERRVNDERERAAAELERQEYKRRMADLDTFCRTHLPSELIPHAKLVDYEQALVLNAPGMMEIKLKIWHQASERQWSCKWVSVAWYPGDGRPIGHYGKPEAYTIATLDLAFVEARKRFLAMKKAEVGDDAQ